MMIYSKQIKKWGLLLLITALGHTTLFAENIKVTAIVDLQRAINRANPRDVITLANGTYITAEDIVVNRTGTAAHPIIICAETMGGAEIGGVGGFSLVSPAAYIIIKGFKFTHESKKARTGGGTSFCRFTQNIFENSGDGEDLTIAGNDQEVDYNTFQNKNAMGRMLAIRGTGSQIAERLLIHHNYFKNYKDQGGKNGAETLQFGLSGFSMSTSNSIVEYNLFEDCAGENELISVKASGVTLRYNTIRNCPAQFTLRHGNKCLVYNNYFINTPGIRIFGDDHLITGNYFENCKPAITIGNGDGEVADSAKLTVHDRPDRVVISYNILVNNAQNYVMTQRKDGLGATDVTFAYNIIQGGGAASTITGPYNGAKWEGNLLFDVKDAGSMPAAGYANMGTALQKNQSGFFALTDKTQLKNSEYYYPNVRPDLGGKAAPKSNYILTSAQVGYHAVVK